MNTEQRLARLERQLAAWRLASIISVGILIVLGCTHNQLSSANPPAQQSASYTHLSTQELTLVDASGRVMARLGSGGKDDWNDPAAAWRAGQEAVDNSGYPRLVMYDKAGHRIVLLGVSHRGALQYLPPEDHADLILQSPSGLTFTGMAAVWNDADDNGSSSLINLASAVPNPGNLINFPGPAGGEVIHLSAYANLNQHQQTWNTLSQIALGGDWSNLFQGFIALSHGGDVPNVPTPVVKKSAIISVMHPTGTGNPHQSGPGSGSWNHDLIREQVWP